MSGSVVFAGLDLSSARAGASNRSEAEGGSHVPEGLAQLAAECPAAPESGEGVPFAADRGRVVTAANFVLTVWGHDGADVDEYWSRVQPLVTVAFYDSPGGAEVEAGAGVAEAGGPSVAPAFVAEGFEGFEVTEQGPGRVEGVAMFTSE